MAVKKIKLTVPSDLKSMTLVGPIINKVCAQAGMNKAEAGQMELCVVEAVNNCFRHSYKSQAGHEIEVGISVESKKVTFQVCDNGEAMDTDKLKNSLAKPASGDIKTIPVQGRGLFIISKLMTHVEYSRSQGKNELTMIKEWEK